MAGERTFLVRILGNADSAITAFKKLGKEGSDALGEVFDVAKKGALIATAAAGAIAGAAFSAVKAATEDQESQKLLADQLRRTMQATDEQIASVEEYISKQQMLVGVADDQLRPALSNLARATGDLNFAQKNLNLALDISAATGIELETVSLALGKAFTGNIGALTKLGVPIDENVKKSKDLASVVETLNQQFGGAASDAANTFSGRLKILKLSIGEAWEGIGYALLPIAEKLVAFIQKNVVPVIQAFADELSGGGSLRDALVAAAAQAGDFGMKIIDMVETVVNVVGYIGNVFIDIAKPIILAGGAIGSLIALVKDGKDGFDKVGIATQNFVAVLDGLKINSAVTGAAFDSFRNSVLGVAAAANLTQDELRTLDQVQRGIAAGGPVQKFIGPLLEGYGSLAPKTKTAAQLQAEFNKKLSELSGAGGGGGAAKKATSAIDNAKKALETYTSALNKVTSSQKAFESAQKATAAAKKQLGKRDEDLATAQERFNKAVAGYGADSAEAKDAQKKLAIAQRNVEQAGYRVEEAVFAVSDAEKKLAEVRKDPESNPQMIREAEINLAQAKLAVKDAIDAQNEATDSQTESQSKLNEVVNGAIVGSVVYESLLKELNDAKDAQAEASDNVAEAVKREAEAYKDLADAIRTAALAAGASGQTFTAPTLPTVPTPTNTGTTLTGGRTEQGTPTIVINTGIGTNGVEAGRQIVGVLQEYTKLDRNAIAELVRR
ncbi:MAG: hypothetical protein EB117_15030 [Betaproteobacteria bacterium]|nr:hypothetical protein [Betaproteobacteria bacterium]